MPRGRPPVDPKIVAKITKEYLKDKSTSCTGLAIKYELGGAATVWNLLKRQGIEIRKRGPGWSNAPIPDNVEDCNGGYHAHRKKHKLAMLRKQKWRCAICADKITQITGRVDHCHITTKIRGVLCDRCNIGLGHFLDSPKMLKAALAYLEEA